MTQGLPVAGSGRTTLFTTCPVGDIERATAFSAALGCNADPSMSSAGGSCIVFTPGQHPTLVSRELYASVGGTAALVGPLGRRRR